MCGLVKLSLICGQNPHVVHAEWTTNLRILNCTKTLTESVQIGKTLDCSSE